MRKQLLIALMLFVSLNFVWAQPKFVKGAETELPQLLQKGEAKAWCPVCGMNLKMFYKTNHALTLENGSTHQYCSIRCLAVDLQDHPGRLEHALAIDVKSEKFIPVKYAYYVVGSKIPGTMTRESKLAFASKRSAKKFSKVHGGKSILDFNSALELAREQMLADNAMLMKKKQKMMHPKGEILYAQYCSNTEDFRNFKTIPELKVYLKKQTSNEALNEKQLQMLALYIWDVKLHERPTESESSEGIIVPEDEKCPVCGMFVYKYPRWAAILNVSTEGLEKHLYFDGVKDLVKFYQHPEKWGAYDNIKMHGIMVTDYYQQTALDGQTAVYVIGSDVLGPMGHELIPFTSMEQAQVFIEDHSGERILKFDEITENIINALDN